MVGWWPNYKGRRHRRQVRWADYAREDDERLISADSPDDKQAGDDLATCRPRSSEAHREAQTPLGRRWQTLAMSWPRVQKHARKERGSVNCGGLQPSCVGMPRPRGDVVSSLLSCYAGSQHQNQHRTLSMEINRAIVLGRTKDMF